MGKPIRRLFFIIIVISFWSNFSVSEELRKDPCDDSPLPASAQKLLAERYPSWSVLTLKDLTDREQEKWLKSQRSSFCPGIAVGNYENQVDKSYAVVLIPSDRGKASYKLLVVSWNKTLYQLRVLEEPTSPVNWPVVYEVPPGKYVDFHRKKSVTLIQAGFQVEWMGVAAYLYYWRNGQYHQLSLME
jgi:hypothetical protein